MHKGCSPLTMDACPPSVGQRKLCPPSPFPSAGAAAAGRRRWDTMIRHLRGRILCRLLHNPCPGAPPAPLPFYPHRLLSAAASTIPPKPFAVEEYLVDSCGLTRAQAVKASKKISHLQTPSKPDAVLAFLSGLDMPRSDVAVLVARDPQFLCASVEKTLAPRVAELKELGLSSPQIARLIPLALSSFRLSSVSGNLCFWLSVFNGSFETLLRALRLNSGLLRGRIEKVVTPNLVFLRQCGLSVSEVAVMNMYSSRLFLMKPVALREAADRVEELGIKCGSWNFRHALALVALMSKEDVSKKIELLHKIGFSPDDALLAVRRAPTVLRLSEEKIRRAMYFLTQDVGLKPPYIAQRATLFTCSLERRLMPRYFLLRLLREKGLLNAEPDYYNTIVIGEKTFVEKFVHPYKDLIPGLTDDYTSVCSRKTA